MTQCGLMVCLFFKWQLKIFSLVRFITLNPCFGEDTEEEKNATLHLKTQTYWHSVDKAG